jgi:hypothetical protein
VYVKNSTVAKTCRTNSIYTYLCKYEDTSALLENINAKAVIRELTTLVAGRLLLLSPHTLWNVDSLALPCGKGKLFPV